MRHGIASIPATSGTCKELPPDLGIGYERRAAMLTSHLQHDFEREYLDAVERTEELARMRERARARKSMLLFGPEGVGKSRLLQTFCVGERFALLVNNSRSPREFFLELVEAIRPNVKGGVIPKDLTVLSARSLKGVAQRALDLAPFLIAIDHISGPSRVLTGAIKDLYHYGRTPILFAACSPHMEDIGALRGLCALKEERIELKNWPQPVALEFAKRQAEAIGLWAANLESALSSFVEWSGGNPASILSLLKMASRAKYRMEDQIKAHILYVDYRMGYRD
jgi:hypothetical protein